MVTSATLVTGKGKYPLMETLAIGCTLHGLGGKLLILGAIIMAEVGTTVKVSLFFNSNLV